MPVEGMLEYGMGKLTDLFTRHPLAVGMTYWEHFTFAAGVGTEMVLAGLGCVIHSLLPFIFATTASGSVKNLSARMHRDIEFTDGAGI